MAHLLEQGYRNIAHISGPLEMVGSSPAKSCWNDFLQEAGLEVCENHWVEGNWSSASGSEAIEKLFQQYSQMDAVFAANDQMAISVIQAGLPEKSAHT